MAADLRRGHRGGGKRSRYFSDASEGSPLNKPNIPVSSQDIFCSSFSFEERHDASRYSKGRSRFCLSCGVSSHEAEECPLYLMELSIRGYLTDHIEQQREKRKEKEKGQTDKGKFPGVDRSLNGSSSSKLEATNAIASGSGELAWKGNSKNQAFNAVQCVVCGCMGHANCTTPPLTGGILFCPSCSLTGHMIAECPRRFDRDLREKNWRGLSRQTAPPGYTRTECIPPRPKYKRKRENHTAKAAKADPWHPSHLKHRDPF